MIDDFLTHFVNSSVTNPKFTKGRSKTLRLVVIHDMEAPENATTAETVSAWSANNVKIRSSWHVAVDADSAVQSVATSNTAWHAPGANSDGFGIEQAGYARQTRAEWLDAFSLATLDHAARVAAAVCVKYKISPVHITPAQLLAGKSGLVGHRDVTAAYPKIGTHTDPGTNFPWDVFTAKVVGYIAQIKGGSITVPVSPPVKVPVAAKTTFKQGDSGAGVQSFQQKLKSYGFTITADGQFGATTEKITRSFQARVKLPQTGEADAATLKALALALAKAPAVPTASVAVSAKLKIDGVLNVTVISALQKQLDVAVTGKIDAPTVRALQKKVGTRADGSLGPNTTKALQRFVGALQDGAWGAGTTAAVQRALNAGKFK